MARWNIRRALEVAAAVARTLARPLGTPVIRLGLDDTELVRWRTVAETMFTGWNSQTGLFEQFAGFFGLEEIDLAGYAGRSVPMDVVLGRERTQRSKVIKQADVVALLGLLPEEFPGDSGEDELPLLRAALRPRQFPQRRHAWAGRGPAGRLGPRAAVFPAYGGDRSGR